MKGLSEFTGRNVIAYYSSWLNKHGVNGLDINDSDMTGFMNCIHEMDCSKGLDLILHTSGGDLAAAEPLVERPKALGDIRGVSYIYGIFRRFGLIEVPALACK